MKKFLYRLLAIVFVLSLLTACSPNVEEIYEYENVKGGIEITKYKGNDKKIVVPEIINNQKVVSVGNAFSGNVVVESITLPESCSIGNFLGCDNLEYLECPGKSEYFNDPSIYCPTGIKKLIITGVDYINLSDVTDYTELEYLDISGAEKIYDIAIKNLTECPNLKTICIAKMKSYELYRGSHSEYNLYTHVSSYEEEITEDNYADVMKMIFGDNIEIKVVEH